MNNSKGNNARKTCHPLAVLQLHQWPSNSASLVRLDGDGVPLCLAAELGGDPVACAAPGLHAGLPGRLLSAVVGGGEAGGETAGAVLALLQVQGGQAQLHQRTVRVPAVVDHRQVDSEVFSCTAVKLTEVTRCRRRSWSASWPRRREPGSGAEGRAGSATGRRHLAGAGPGGAPPGSPAG